MFVFLAWRVFGKHNQINNDGIRFLQQHNHQRNIICLFKLSILIQNIAFNKCNYQTKASKGIAIDSQRKQNKIWNFEMLLSFTLLTTSLSKSKKTNERETCHYYFSGCWVDDYSRDHQYLNVSPSSHATMALTFYMFSLYFFKLNMVSRLIFVYRADSFV